jgi:hypothetical protein
METPSPVRSAGLAAPSHLRARSALLVSAAILALATALRVRGGWNDLWLDEIWSLAVARDVREPLDVFTRIHHEINHYGNTLWLWVAGWHGDWIGYRVPSLVAGVGSVALAGWIARRRGRAAVVFTLLVASCSYVLVLYSSEVRGYSMLVFASYLSYVLLDEYLRSDRWTLGAALSVVEVLGLVSHLLFESVLLAAIAASAFAFWRRRLSPGGAARRLALCHALPLACLAALYVVDLREIVAGGGGTATGSLIADYGTALAWALGAPVSPAAQLVGCVLAVVVLDAGVRLVARDDPPAALFFVGAILVFPVLLAVARSSPVLYTRHFILPIAFLTLLLGFDLAALYERGRGYRWAAAALLVLFAVANGAHLRDLFRYGRGQNGAALRFILEHSGPGPVTIAADDDFRIRRVVEFYAAEQGAGTRVEYQPRGTWQGAGPEWLIVNRDSFERAISRGEQIQDETGRRFDLVASFPAAPLAGLHWFVYRNESR